MSVAFASRAIIHDDERRLLLGKQTTGLSAGKWSFIGGRDGGSELVRLAAARHVREQTNLEFVYARLFRKLDYDEDQDPLGRIWNIAYLVGTAVGDLVLNEEVSEVGYFERGEIVQLPLAFGHDEIVAEYFDQS